MKYENPQSTVWKNQTYNNLDFYYFHEKNYAQI